MRALIICTLIFISLGCYAQTEKVRVFRKAEYINGNFSSQTFDSINVANKIFDIYFFKENFYLPYYLPKSFVDKQYRNQKLSFWKDPKGKKNYQQNWENTYTYDSLGRVINYTYSGCFICSNMPYDYIVSYTLKGQVETITNTTGTKDSFKFYYNSRGNLVKLEKYTSGTLEEEITLTK